MPQFGMDTLLTLTQFSGFLAAALLITLAPGPDNLMVLGLGMSRGKREGIAFGLGCATGCLSHTALAALGVSALIAASAHAFALLRVAGGIYLLWLGFQALRHPGAAASSAPGTEARPVALFWKGMVANAINPKVILFFLAFLPQFIDAGRGSVAWQTVQLGVTFTIQAALIFGAIGWFAGRIGQSLAARPGIGIWLDRIAGGIFVALGLRLLLSR